MPPGSPISVMSWASFYLATYGHRIPHIPGMNLNPRLLLKAAAAINGRYQNNIGVRLCTSYTSPGAPFNTVPCDCEERKNSTELAELTDLKYHAVADETMAKILNRLDEVFEEVNVSGMDISFSDGVLNLSLGELGTYVLNKQPPNKQIWLSSPISGAMRFDYVDDKLWYSKKRNMSLGEVMSKELSDLFKTKLIMNLD